MTIERKSAELIEVKLAGDGTGSFSGYGAIFGNIDSYGDIIAPGAFAKSLTTWKGRGKLPKMLLQHGGFSALDGSPVGQWTDMAEDAKGLAVKGRLFALDTERGQYIYEGLKSGELDSLSIGYQTVNSTDSVVDGEEIRTLTELKLWEVSIVTFPANDQALISGVKALTSNDKRDLEDDLGDLGLSRAARVKAVSVFEKWLQRDAGVPTSAPRDEASAEEAEILKSLERLYDMTWSQVFRG